MEESFRMGVIKSAGMEIRITGITMNSANMPKNPRTAPTAPPARESHLRRTGRGDA